MNIKEYFNGHSVKEIKVGKSGADLYEVDGAYVVKHGLRQKLQEEQFAACTREALFYRDPVMQQKTYVPAVQKAEASENETLIIMKKYERLKRSEIRAELIQKIAKALAALHLDDAPSFLCRDKEEEKPLSESLIAECLKGWKRILAEHPGVFDESRLEDIAGKINKIIAWHNTEERVLVHGDFHWDNLLADENEKILFCDWQSVKLGTASGDLSFFLSRLGGDGVQIVREMFLDYYVDAVRALSGKRIERQEMIRHMSAANVITSFVFWHHYLEGSTEERVRDIYGKMLMDEEACHICQ